jgi:hypothetical protein
VHPLPLHSCQVTPHLSFMALTCHLTTYLVLNEQYRELIFSISFIGITPVVHHDKKNVFP